MIPHRTALRSCFYHGRLGCRQYRLIYPLGGGSEDGSGQVRDLYKQSPPTLKQQQAGAESPNILQKLALPPLSLLKRSLENEFLGSHPKRMICSRFSREKRSSAKRLPRRLGNYLFEFSSMAVRVVSGVLPNGTMSKPAVDEL